MSTPFVLSSLVILLQFAEVAGFTEPKPFATDYSTFYLLQNGSNIAHCGHDVTTACATFPYLLDVYWEKYNTTLPALKVLSDMSVEIDKELQEQRDWLSELDVSFHNIDVISSNITLILDSVYLANCTYETKFFNVFVNNSKLVNYILRFQYEMDKRYGFHQEHSGPKRHLIIKRSNLTGFGDGSKTMIGLSHATAELAELNVINLLQVEPILHVSKGCEVLLTNCTFHANSVVDTETQKNSPVNVHNSTMKVINSKFDHNKGVKGGVFCVNLSSVLIWNSTFVLNSASYSGGVFYIEHSYQIVIESSTFSSNQAQDHGGVLSGSHTNFLRISHTIFWNNKAGNSDGGCLSMLYDTTCHIDHSKFNHSSAYKNGGVMFLGYNVSLIVKDTIFFGNDAGLNSGVLSISHQASAQFSFCTFHHNTAKLTESVISANNHVNMIIEHCDFSENPSPFTGVLEGGNEVKVKISDTTFTANSAKIGSLMEFGNTTLEITNSYFSENTGGSLLYGYNKTSVIITNCSFQNHSLSADPLIVIAGALLKMNQCVFINNTQNKEGGIVIAKENSMVNVYFSKFQRNYGSKGGVFYITSESELVVESSTFLNNTAGDGGVAYLTDSSATLIKSNFSNNNATAYGGVSWAYNSKITVTSCNFSGGSAVYGGSFELELGTILAVHNSTFLDNTARMGGAIYKYGDGTVSLENTYLINNTGKYGGAICMDQSQYLRLANGSCQFQYSILEQSPCVLFQYYFGLVDQYKYVIDTLDYTINNGNESLNSKDDENFLNQTLKNGMIYSLDLRWSETPFASLNPVFCGEGSKCRCYFSPTHGNVYNCSGKGLSVLPPINDHLVATNFLDMSHNNFTVLTGQYSYMKTLTGLDLSNNRLRSIEDDSLRILDKLQTLDLSDNRLKGLPQQILHLVNLTDLKFSGNPLNCNCKMLTVKIWIENEGMVVSDYDAIYCQNKGIPLHALNPEDFGCIPLWQRIVIGVSAAVIIAIVIAIIAISRRWDEVKWLMYRHFDILDKTDGAENLKGIEKDALLSYSELDVNIMRKLFMENSENTSDACVVLEKKHGFQLILHQRDFMPGMPIMFNIAQAVARSRRMIVLLSRLSKRVRFGMPGTPLCELKKVLDDELENAEEDERRPLLE